jgi:hypothetical protein
VVMHGEVYDRVVLPTDVPSNRSVWEKVLDLQPEYHPVKRRIRFLVEKGLTSTMVLHDFVSKHITPFQYRAQPAWLYIGPSDTTCLECGNKSDLEPDVLAATLSKLSTDLNSHYFITPPELCAPICLNQAARSLLLSEMSSLDNINLAT